ncbi:NmrA family NAD(P)-binding protein [Paenibacillus sp. FSL H7-0716]|uniref:NAD(P)-dependent oxidoreductase n=1 Tax=Paenibacillus odorifer TaxID=189426 RepID=A0AB36JF34_9BACL|nr:NmrA family NAD(P)-binding protein [Paenibacillus odorifer]OME20138.1 NAD(P)-dependent oxidoreductase [Paenibacillus odorifer]
MSIMVTGATGQLGSLIMEDLEKYVPASQVIACVRQREKAANYLEKGFEVRFGDYDQLDSLIEAFTGVTTLLLISSSHTDDKIRLNQHAQVIHAAKKADVKHLLYTGFAFPPKGPIPSYHIHLLTEQLILESGIAYTFLRNALYIDFVGVLGLKEAMESGELPTYPGNWQFNSVTREDLALATAKVLTTSGHENQVYELAAPNVWDFNDLVDVLSELSGKRITYRQDSSIQHWIYSFLAKIDTASTSKDLERLMERPVTTLRESIKPFV